MIAFSEAFTPLFGWIQTQTGIIPQTWMFSVPATIILLIVIIRKGADLGVYILWVVVCTLGISLLVFFLGKGSAAPVTFDFFRKVENPDNFFRVFAIIFPAFTGMTAGVGLSGDLKNPRRSIPLGTISATLVGMVVYVFVILKLAMNMPVEDLASDQFVMSKIALWGPIIPIGLGAATLSSAIGSVLIAPRTMQALARDKIFPVNSFNNFVGAGKGESNEPVNATLITAIIILVFVSMGSVDFVAQVISMFFMITYGSLCLVSFLEHFAGNPSYRPTFRSKWYVSLLGALGCFIMMFQMAPLYAILAFVSITIIYLYIKSGYKIEDDLSTMVKGVLFQLTRTLQVLIQQKQSGSPFTKWRPSFIAISSSTQTRLAPFDFLRWISHYYGFGTFIHYVKGMLDEKTNEEAEERFNQLLRLSRESKSGIYVDTIISPSFKTAVAQLIQIPGISGLENNSILFEFQKDETGDISDIIDGCHFASLVDFNICVLRSSERHFGYNRMIHIWLTPGDYRNANMMILLAYILLGHPTWKGCEIEIYAAFEKKELDKQYKRLNDLIDKGRIPIASKNVTKIPWDRRARTYENLVTEHSSKADLVIMGFSINKLAQDKGEFLKKFSDINDLLFVRAGQKIIISDDD